MASNSAVGIIGWSGVGKTTLIEKLLPMMAARGMRVSTVKHCHHDVLLDQPGKDTDRHQRAGAVQTMLISPAGSLILERSRQPEAPIHESLRNLSDVDFVLLEGFRNYPFPRLEVWHSSADRSPMALSDRGIAALVSDSHSGTLFDRPVFRRDDVDGIAQFVIALVRTPRILRFGA